MLAENCIENENDDIKKIWQFWHIKEFHGLLLKARKPLLCALTLMSFGQNPLKKNR